ncbi:hypothetical protein [Paraburkholderia youngii]
MSSSTGSIDVVEVRRGASGHGRQSSSAREVIPGTFEVLEAQFNAR